MPKKVYECMFTDFDGVTRFGLYCQTGADRDASADYIICGCCGGIIADLPIETTKIEIEEHWEPVSCPPYIL